MSVDKPITFRGVALRVSAGLLGVALLTFAVYLEIGYPGLAGTVLVGIVGLLIQRTFLDGDHRWGLYLGIVLGSLISHPLATLLGAQNPDVPLFDVALGTAAVLGCAALLGFTFTGRM